MPTDQHICLCMIVKDEARVIARCLTSVRPLIDHWIIVDTGSIDGTQDIIRAELHDLPGEVIERPWRDFATNRTESIALARPHGDYLLIIDADDTLDIPADFVLPTLRADFYSIDIQLGLVRYDRPQIIKAALPWRYVGVLHEFLDCDGATTSGRLPLTLHVSQDGARRTDPQTYRNDATVLERALTTETDPMLRARYTFYLARSYRDAGDIDSAIATYLTRAEMGHWDQEVFASLYDAGRQMVMLGRDAEAALAVFARATAACPYRAEAAHAASKLCRMVGLYERGYAIAKAALDLVEPVNGLLVEPWIYRYGLRDEAAVNAYWCGHYRECLDLTLRALESGDVPVDDHPRLLANMRFALNRLP